MECGASAPLLRCNVRQDIHRRRETPQTLKSAASTQKNHNVPWIRCLRFSLYFFTSLHLYFSFSYSIHPPLTFTTCPVTYSASSEAKYATECATSSTVGGRPIGKRASRIFRASLNVNSFSSMLDGFTTFTVIPFFASSSAKDRDSATTAAFAAAYAEIFAWPNARSAPTAPKLIIRPHRPRRMCGSAARVTYSTVIRFDEIIFCQSSSGDSANVPQRKSPTLFTRISSRPNRSTTVRTNCSDRAGSLISISTATQSVPAACSCRNVCCAAALFDRYAIAIRAPSFASFTAIPRPIPRLPPVTSATRFCNPILIPHRPRTAHKHAARQHAALQPNVQPATHHTTSR